MPYKDLRSFIEKIQDEGELLRVKEEVDWYLEIGAFMRKALDEKERYALLFEKIKDYPENHKFFGNTFANHSKYALALGLPKNTPVGEIIKEYRKRVANLIKPKIVDDGECKENILKDDEVNLLKFPVPHLHRMDGGRYIGTFHCVITKDPDTGWTNVALYRNMVHDEKTLGIYMHRPHHGAQILRKYVAMGKPMPVAIAIGQEPVNILAAFHSAEAGVSEWEVAGGLRGAPVELIRCETIDLEVPTTAEIVIEGEIPPNELRDEGSFGEYTGYMAGGRAPRPIIRVKCITYRDNPIMTGTLNGKPYTEQHVMISVGLSAMLEKLLIDDLKLGVKAVYYPPSSVLHGVIVSLKQEYPGQAKRVAEAIWASPLGLYSDYVFVVGEDINPTDVEEVLWALCTRCKPDRDITIIQRERASLCLPSLTPEERVKEIGCKILFEALFPAEWPKEWIPTVVDWFDWPTEVRKKVEEKWKNLRLK